MDILLLALAIIITGFILPVFIIKYGKLMSIKGYSVSLISLLSFIYFSVTLFFTAGFVVGIFTVTGFWGAFLTLLICLTVLIGLYGLFATKISYRENRAFGKRKIPLSLPLGLYALLFCLVGMALMIFAVTLFPEKFYGPPLKWHDYLMFAGTLSLMIAYLRAGFKRKRLFKKQKEITDYTDRKFDVLYLRSFYLDVLPFSKADAKETDEFGSLIKLKFFIYQDLRFKAELTFEEYFGFQINKQMGEFVCIGNPNNRIPKDGIIDVYPKWEEWQNFLSIFIEQARIVLMHIGGSKHITYELKTIVKSGNTHKLCLFTQPLHASINKTANWKIRLRNWVNNSKNLNWEEVKEVLLDVGFKIDFTPDFGSVIVFSEDGNAILLKTGCVLPSEYISVLKKNTSQIEFVRRPKTINYSRRY